MTKISQNTHSGCRGRNASAGPRQAQGDRPSGGWSRESGGRTVRRGGGQGKEGGAPRGCVTVKNRRAGRLEPGRGASVARRRDSVNE